MLITIIKKEILNNLLNLRFNLAYVLTAFLIIGSFSIMYSDFLKDNRTYFTNRAIYDQDMKEQTHQWEYLWGAKHISRKPPVTKILAVGAERDPDALADIAPEFSPYFHGDFKRNPMTNLFPSVDMAFIVGVILTLLIFVLGFDSISGERENGTLKVLLSCPVPRDLIILGKWIGGCLSVLIPYFISCLCIALILLLTTTVHITARDWARMGLMFAVCALYIAVIFTIAVWISAMFRQSSTGMLVLLLVWVFGVLVIPAFSAPLAYLHTNPPGVQISQALMRRYGTVGWAREEEERTKLLKKKFGDRKPGELSPTEQKEYSEISRNFWFQYLREYIREPAIAEGKRSDRYEQHIFRKSRLAMLASPYGCLQQCLVRLARTGFHHDQAYRRSIERYAMDAMNYGIEAVKASSESVDTDLSPVFSLTDVPLTDGIVGCIPEIGILLLMGLLSFIGAYIAFLRLDVV